MTDAARAANRIPPCLTCAAWLRSKDDRGECRRRSPRKQHRSASRASWPVTLASDGCWDALERRTGVPEICAAPHGEPRP